jgi:hypothetical protein
MAVIGYNFENFEIGQVVSEENFWQTQVMTTTHLILRIRRACSRSPEMLHEMLSFERKLQELTWPVHYPFKTTFKILNWCNKTQGLESLFWILSDSNVSFDGQSSFFPGFAKYSSIVAKDWYLFTCYFYTYHVIKKDISFCFFFFLFKFEIVRQINAFGKPDLFF